jgi:Family of unknown function (DUF6152)
MRGKRSFLFTLALSVAIPVFAHHSLEAQYDPNHPITINGTLTKIDWSNPHVHFLVDVMEAGENGTWDVELGSPNAQLRGGWKIDTFKPGDRVVVSVYRARDGSHIGFARKITKAGK